MVQKKPKERKLPLPLRFKVGTDGIIDDGFFILTHKDVSEIVVKSIDPDGYLICELLEPEKSTKPPSVTAELEARFIGEEKSRHRGRGKKIGLYKYFERPDGYIIAEISGKRIRRVHLGSLKDHASRISIVKQTIAQHFQIGKEFEKKELSELLPKPLRSGQTLKSALDVLKIKGYLDMKETKYRGRPHERYIPTNKIHDVIPMQIKKWLSSEQA